MKIVTRLTLLLISGVGLVYIALQLYTSHYYTEMIKKQISLETETISLSAINQISSLRKDVENMVKLVETGLVILKPDMAAQVYDYLTQIVESSNQIGGQVIGMGIAFNPSDKEFAPYIWSEGESINRVNLALQYDYTSYHWYQTVQETEKPFWTEPYVEPTLGDNVYVVTYAYPMMRQGKLKGIIKADIALTRFRDFLQTISGFNKYVVVITKSKGTFLSHPEAAKIATSGLNSKYPEDIQETVQQMMYKDKGSLFFMLYGKKFLINYFTLPALNWSVGVVFDTGKVTSAVSRLEYKNFFVLLAGLFFLLLIIFIVAKSITRPLRHLATHIKNLGEGDLSQKVPYTEGTDEISFLAQSFSLMQDKMAKYIQTEKKLAIEKEKMESEVRYAREIQENFLPQDTCFGGDNRICIASYLNTAKDVGGDLYDFFYWDEDNLFVIIGDASDKGIPASIYMSMVLSFTRVLSKLLPSPAEIAKHINDYMVNHNQNSMFVTTLTLMINLKTGKVTVLNAGHGMLRHLRNGIIINHPLETNIALGVVPDVEFKQTSFVLEKGDMLFLYTDGVTDAVNSNREFFGEDNLNHTLKMLDKQKSPNVNLGILVSKILAYIRNTKPADDMAMVLLKYNGK